MYSHRILFEFIDSQIKKQQIFNYNVKLSLKQLKGKIGNFYLFQNSTIPYLGIKMLVVVSGQYVQKISKYLIIDLRFNNKIEGGKESKLKPGGARPKRQRCIFYVSRGRCAEDPLEVNI